MEMSGIEPESEKLRPHTSTSVVICKVSLKESQLTNPAFNHPLGPESPSYTRLAELPDGTLALCRLTSARSVSGARGRDPVLESD